MQLRSPLLIATQMHFIPASPGCRLCTGAGLSGLIVIGQRWENNEKETVAGFLPVPRRILLFHFAVVLTRRAAELRVAFTASGWCILAACARKLERHARQQARRFCSCFCDKMQYQPFRMLFWATPHNETKRVQSHMVDIRILPLWVHQQKPERHMFQALPNCENDLAVDECSGVSCA